MKSSVQNQIVKGEKMWKSPDGKINKVVVTEGIWGKKPSEYSQYEVLITDCPEIFLEFNNRSLVLGDSDNAVERILDLCLITMNEGETAKFNVPSENWDFTVKLIKVNVRGLIYQWNAKRKFEIAQKYKDKGVELFKSERAKDAAFRFSKALKILHSIPIDVEATPDVIDTVKLDDINTLKATLYSNLSSYYFKLKAWQQIIDACKKTLQYDFENIKAHYKLGVAYISDRNFEEAEKELNFVLAKEPNNKAAADHMKHVKAKLREAEEKMNNLIKKMFN